MHIRIQTTGLLMIMVLLAGTSAVTGEENGTNGYDDAFRRLQSLVGAWEIDESPSKVTYSLTGNGTSVIE